LRLVESTGKTGVVASSRATHIVRLKCAATFRRHAIEAPHKLLEVLTNETNYFDAEFDSLRLRLMSFWVRVAFPEPRWSWQEA